MAMLLKKTAICEKLRFVGIQLLDLKQNNYYIVHVDSIYPFRDQFYKYIMENQ